jgi:hypothetical protein
MNPRCRDRRRWPRRRPASRSPRSPPSSPSATRSTRSRTTSRRRDAGQLRAGDRLRGHQDPPLGVREAPRHDGRARHADAVGGRGDGDRPHLPREPAEGAAVARTGPLGLGCDPAERAARRPVRRRAARPGGDPTPDRIFQVGALLRRGVSIDASTRRPDRPVVPRPDVDDHRGASRRWRRRSSTR